MSIRALQKDYLRHTIERANEIEKELANARRSRLAEVHFRPSSSAISMISLRPKLPLLGESYKNSKRLAMSFENEFQKHCVQRTLKRHTPEKELQSYLIANAYRNSRKLGELTVENEVKDLIFVTDELALPTDNGKLVCDILAVQGAHPVVIELKTRRLKTQLVKQVSSYSELLEEHCELFEELFSVILHRRVTLQKPCQRWIVWPYLPGHDRDPQEESLAHQDIRVVEYSKTPGCFEFRVGKPVRSSPI